MLWGWKISKIAKWPPYNQAQNRNWFIIAKLKIALRANSKHCFNNDSEQLQSIRHETEMKRMRNHPRSSFTFHDKSWNLLVCHLWYWHVSSKRMAIFLPALDHWIQKFFKRFLPFVPFNYHHYLSQSSSLPSKLLLFWIFSWYFPSLFYCMHSSIVHHTFISVKYFYCVEVNS